MVVKIQRDPVDISEGPWSEYVQVFGITTPPPDVTTPTASSGPFRPPESPSITRTLIFILIPVGVVLLVGIALVLVLVICFWYKRK